MLDKPYLPDVRWCGWLAGCNAVHCHVFKQAERPRHTHSYACSWCADRAHLLVVCHPVAKLQVHVLQKARGCRLLLPLPHMQLTGTHRAGTNCIKQHGLQHLVILFTQAQELRLC